MTSLTYTDKARMTSSQITEFEYRQSQYTKSLLPKIASSGQFSLNAQDRMTKIFREGAAFDKIKALEELDGGMGTYALNDTDTCPRPIDRYFAIRMSTQLAWIDPDARVRDAALSVLNKPIAFASLEYFFERGFSGIRDEGCIRTIGKIADLSGERGEKSVSLLCKLVFDRANLGRANCVSPKDFLKYQLKAEDVKAAVAALKSLNKINMSENSKENIEKSLRKYQERQEELNSEVSCNCSIL